jgi:hypothetical protein
MMSSSQSRFALVIATCLGRNLSKSDIHSLKRTRKWIEGHNLFLLPPEMLRGKVTLEIRYNLKQYLHTGLRIVNKSNLNQYLQSRELCSIIPANRIVSQNVIMLQLQNNAICQSCSGNKITCITITYELAVLQLATRRLSNHYLHIW